MKNRNTWLCSTCIHIYKVLLLLLLSITLTLLSVNTMAHKDEEGSGTITTLSPYIEIGRTTFNSNNSWGGTGVRINDKWDFNISLVGFGKTKNGVQHVAPLYSFTRIIPTLVTKGRVKLKLGLSYAPENRLIGKINYRLGILFDCAKTKWYGEIFHISSGDINEVNTGIDGVLIGYRIGE